MNTFRSARILFLSAVAAVVAAVMPSCHHLENWDNDLYGNFDALWAELDHHYCFFDLKDVDWEETGARYRAQIDPEMTDAEFFDLCAAMLAELRDGHTNLASWFNVSYYRKWWSDYPQNFNLRLIQQNYLDFDYNSGGPIIYKLLEEQNVGYMRFSTFSAGYGMSFVDAMMLSMKDSDGLIIDVRDNGGGDLTVVEQFVSQFIASEITAGYICHKTGPGHSDFSELFEYRIKPAEGHVRWLKRVVVLCNRSTFSAANNFVGIMKTLSHVAVVGDITGGGSGMPYSSELPCGWSVRFSGCPVYDPDMNLTEFGIYPSPGCKVDMDPQAEFEGRDTMLDFAINLLREAAENDKQEAPRCTSDLQHDTNHNPCFIEIR